VPHLPLQIKTDYREKRSGIPDLLIQKNVDVIITPLPVGDYIINDQIIIERKSAEDFVSSLISKRLFQQCARLKKNKPQNQDDWWRDKHNILLIIEGNPYTTNHFIKKEAIKGAILSILISWQIPVIHTKNTKDTAELLFLIAKKYAGNNKLCNGRVPTESQFRSRSTYSSPTTSKSSFPVKQKKQKIYFLEGFPGIGHQLSKRLANHFQNIESIIVASAYELTKIKGIGSKQAGLIKKFLKS